MAEADAVDTASNGWDDGDWEGLLYAIALKEVTPFLGAGACHGVLKLGKEIARDWVDRDPERGFPFSDVDNLPRVAQWLAVERGADVPKSKIRLEFKDKGPPDFANPNEPHRVLADLELPLYMTTNYDDFMFQALKRESTRSPHREVCKWHLINGKARVDLQLPVRPDPKTPVVFHLHGTLDDGNSMVLTEDDYVDFLIAVSEYPELIPQPIEGAFGRTSLLFMGYSLEDMSFKVLFRKLSRYIHRNKGSRHVSVQLAPQPDGSTQDQARRAANQKRYLEELLRSEYVKIYWGTCQQFVADLSKRWQAYQDKRAQDGGTT